MNLNDIWNQKEFFLQILIFIVQVLSLVFLGVYVWKTWQMASSTKASVKASEKMIAEMRYTRDQESAPYVVPFININHHMMYFGIKNIGKTVAKNIKLEIEPKLKQHIGIGNIEDISLIKNGLSPLPPGQEIGTMFAVSHIYLKQADSPKKYLVKITFLGGLSNVQREYEQILDLSVYHDLIPDEDKRLSDIVKELENLTKNNIKIGENLEKINQNFVEGIWIINPDLFMQNGKDDSKSWKSIAISKLSELKFILSWMVEESDDFPPKNTQIRMNSLAMQLSIISSNHSANFNSKIIEKIISLAKAIIKFSESEHFVYGRKLEGFNEEINKHYAAVDDLIKLIEARPIEAIPSAPT